MIDLEDHTLVRTVNLQDHGFSASAKPHHVAVEADGSFWYVSLIGENVVAKFNREDELVGQVEMETPGMVVVHPDRDLLLVGRSMSAVSPPRSLGLVRRSDMTIREVPIQLPRIHAVGVRGQYAYIASLAENRFAVLDLDTDDLSFVTFEGPPQVFVQFATAPRADVLVVTGQMGNALHVYDISNPAQPVYERSVAVEAAPWHPVYTPDGRFVYFGNKRANAVTVIDAGDWTVETTITGEGLAQPHGSAVSTDGRFVYISNNNLQETYTPPDGSGGSLVVVSTDDQTITEVLDLGLNPTGIGR